MRRLSIDGCLSLQIPDDEAGLIHGFSTIALGSMAAGKGDNPRTPARRAFAAQLGLDADRLVVAGAVHGAQVARVDEPAPVVPGADALVTDRPGLPLLVTCADCYPIVLYDPTKRTAGVAHAGWRGTAAGVAGAAVAKLQAEYGSRPADMWVGIGPGICGHCYEVSAEVAARFDTEFLEPSSSHGRHLLDLLAANRAQLEAAGVQPGRVHSQGACTRESPDLPSHRRSPDGARFACIAAIA
jgi:YfiH family protein